MINPDDFRWCVDNDYQIYVKKVSDGFRVAVRKGGISSCGKDYHRDRMTGMEYYSRESLGEVLHKKAESAMEALPKVYKHLRYGK